jgi:hypothetical protein
LNSHVPNTLDFLDGSLVELDEVISRWRQAFLVFTPLEPPKYFDETFDLCRDFRVTALWSRAIACGNCNHVLFDEEIQAGWDDDSSDGIDESLNEAKCPCCTTLVKPRIGYLKMPPHTPDVAKSRMSTKVD